MKTHHGDAEEFWAAHLYTHREAFQVSSTFRVQGKTEPLVLTNNQIGATVSVPDLHSESILDAAGAAKLTEKRKELEELAGRCKAGASTLRSLARELQVAEQQLAAGSVLRNGKWLTAQQWSEVQRSEGGAAAATVATLTVKGVTYQQVRLTSVRGTSVGIMHAGGIASLPLDALTPEQTAQLNGTSKTAKIGDPAPASAAVVQARPEPTSVAPSPVATPNAALSATKTDRDRFEELRTEAGAVKSAFNETKLERNVPYLIDGGLKLNEIRTVDFPVLQVSTGFWMIGAVKGSRPYRPWAVLIWENPKPMEDVRLPSEPWGRAIGTYEGQKDFELVSGAVLRLPVFRCKAVIFKASLLSDSVAPPVLVLTNSDAATAE